MSLELLPTELLQLITNHIHSLTDFTNLSSTCRTLHNKLSQTHPLTILRLAAASSRTFFRPSPHLLVAATARSLATWARQSPSNATILRHGMEDGVDGLFALCLRHSAGLTLSDITNLHAYRSDIIPPVVDLIDKSAGQQLWETPELWDGHASTPPSTIDVDCPEAFWHIVIYGELFGGDFDVVLGLCDGDGDSGGDGTVVGVGVGMLGVESRLEYLKYCVPDSFLFAEMEGHRSRMVGIGTGDPRLRVEMTGPYSQREGEGEGELHASQRELQVLLTSAGWQEAWRRVRSNFGEDFDVAWKQRLWEALFFCQGMQGMEMLARSIRGMEPLDRMKDQFVEWRARIESLGEGDGAVRIGSMESYPWPYLYGDLEVLSQIYSH